jgi:hypothetical protein
LIRLFLLLLLVFALLQGCHARPFDLRNPANDTPILAGESGGVIVRGGGSASGRGWDRRALVSLAVENKRSKDLELARKDVVLKLGLRRRKAHSLVGSDESGRVERVRIGAGKRVDLIAQFSAAFAARRKGRVALEFVEAGTGEVVRVDVPFRMRRAKAP